MKAFLPQDQVDVRVNVQDPGGHDFLARHVFLHLLEPWVRGSYVDFLCIGTDRSTGDALGPLVGSELSRADLGSRVCVTGTLDSPLHAGNLASVLETLQDQRTARYIVAIDACLGRAEHVGSVCIGRGPLRPGAGVNKTLPPVGDLYITGTVNVGGFMEYVVLQNTRLGLVVRMANLISRSILTAVGRLRLISTETGSRESPGLL